MRRLLLVSCALAAVACATTAPPGGEEHRERWLAENPDSPWRDLVLERKIAVGMPEEAMLAAWTAGTWSWAGETTSPSGRGEWWRYELFLRGPERGPLTELRTWRVSLEGGVVREIFGPDR